MTPDEINAVKSVWAPIMEAPADFGVAVLEKFFSLYPDQLDKFWFMQSEDMKEFGMRNHGEKVFKTLDDGNTINSTVQTRFSQNRSSQLHH